jgi:23S rRNA pseudouridine2604 synthase
MKLSQVLFSQGFGARRECEGLILGGHVTLDGTVCVDPFRDVDPEGLVFGVRGEAWPYHAKALVLLHKPAGYEAGLDAGPARPTTPASQLLLAANQFKDDRSGIRPLRKHFSAQTLATPLATPASGLVVFTQDWRVARKLSEDAPVMEHEVIVEVSGALAPEGLQRLNRIEHGFTFNGVLLPPAKVSWQNETRLRFALKGERPGQIAYMCESVGLTVLAMKRIRVGRVPMSSLPAGQWRYLLPHERF